MGKIRLLVASDYQIVRSSLRQLLKIDDVFDVLLIEADIGKGLPRICQTLSPDVLLLEVATHSSSSLCVPADVLTVVPNARILLLSTNDNTTYVRAVFATGVLGYILKAAAQSELFQAVKQVFRGRRFLDPRLSNSVPDHLLSPITAATGQPGCKHLSRREIEVLRAIALGFTTKEISKELDLSEKTVQTYRERIYRKLALHTRADLVHYALARGLAGWENSS
jgi:two-component system, NarL family, response regulator NreC